MLFEVGEEMSQEQQGLITCCLYSVLACSGFYTTPLSVQPKEGHWETNRLEQSAKVLACSVFLLF